MLIREIHIEGFKSIVNQTLALGRVNCFIGANGVGKSNVLEAIGVLGAAASGRVDDEAIARRGVRPGLPRLYKTSFARERIPPHITLSAHGDPEATWSHGLACWRSGQRPSCVCRRRPSKRGLPRRCQAKPTH